MKKYLDRQGSSGVNAYEIKPDGIRIQFKNGAVYYYNETSSGIKNIKQMKILAERGLGLSTFISQIVKENYAWKEH